ARRHPPLAGAHRARRRPARPRRRRPSRRAAGGADGLRGPDRRGAGRHGVPGARRGRALGAAALRRRARDPPGGGGTGRARGRGPRVRQRRRQRQRGDDAGGRLGHRDRRRLRAHRLDALRRLHAHAPAARGALRAAGGAPPRRADRDAGRGRLGGVRARGRVAPALAPPPARAVADRHRGRGRGADAAAGPDAAGGGRAGVDAPREGGRARRAPHRVPPRGGRARRRHRAHLPRGGPGVRL
ncbi:MAG: L-gulono-1,4-lactone oxidase, partial [uncultured Actinomycetospora sp.]